MTLPNWTVYWKSKKESKMTAFTLTDHAAIRMAQRGMSLRDAELAAFVGTEVDDGYLVLAKNCKKLESELKTSWKAAGNRRWADHHCLLRFKAPSPPTAATRAG